MITSDGKRNCRASHNTAKVTAEQIPNSDLDSFAARHGWIASAGVAS